MIYIVIPSLIYYCVAFSVYYVFVTLVQCVYVYSNINGLKLLYLSSILAHILKRRLSHTQKTPYRTISDTKPWGVEPALCVNLPYSSETKFQLSPGT